MPITTMEAWSVRTKNANHRECLIARSKVLAHSRKFYSGA